jgi:hypothetical protein
MAAGKWLDGRMIMQDAGKLHWVSANDGIWMASWFDPEYPPPPYSYAKLAYYLRDNGHHEEKRQMLPLFPGGTGYTMTLQIHSDFWNKVDHPFSFRQRGELTDDEAYFFKSMPQRIRDDILAYTKNR